MAQRKTQTFCSIQELRRLSDRWSDEIGRGKRVFAFCLPFIWITPLISFSLAVHKLEPRISARVGCVLMLLTHQVVQNPDLCQDKLWLGSLCINTKSYDKLM